MYQSWSNATAYQGMADMKKHFLSFDFRERPCTLWRVWSLPVLRAMMQVEGDGIEEGGSLAHG